MSARTRSDGSPAIAVTGEPGIGVTHRLRSTADGSGSAAVITGGVRSVGVPLFTLERAVRAELSGDDGSVIAALVEGLGGRMLVIDDLQWVDDRTVDLLGPLAAAVPLMVGVGLGHERSTRALDAAVGAGLTVVPVRPLDDPTVAAALRVARPDLSERDVADLVSSSSGNPGVALRRAGGGLDRTTVAALQAVGAERAAVAPGAALLVALAEGPLPLDAVGASLDALRDADLVVVTGDRCHIRLPELAAGIVAAAGSERIVEAHRDLAGTEHGVARARHLASVGDRNGAVAAGIAAAAEVGGVGRVDALELVSSMCAPNAVAGHLVSSAEAAIDADLALRARDLASRSLETGDPTTKVAAMIVLARAYAMLGSVDDTVGVCDAVMNEPGADDRARGAAEAVRSAALAWPAWQGADARSALDRAVSLGAPSPLADAAAARLGVVTASRPAVRGGAPERVRAWSGLLWAADLASTLTDHLRASTATSDRVLDAVIDVHRRGHLVTLTPVLAELAASADRDVDREVASAHLAIALADSGRTGAAADGAGAAIESARTTAGRALLVWALVEAELAGARLTRCRAAAERAFGMIDGAFPTDALVELCAAWAQHDSGEVVTARGDREVLWPALRGAPLELAAVAALTSGSFDEAEAGFRQAAMAWQGSHRRGYLRCQWATAETSARRGGRDEAIDALRAVEAEASEAGMRPLAARARESLRRAGVRPAPHRGARRGPLTAREAEVLDLVGLGFTTTEIAQALGVAASTVDTQVESGMRKLDARTRVQAAALAGGLAR